jgi:signal transduction histidine kinase
MLVPAMSADEIRPLPDVERALNWIVAGFNLLFAVTLSPNLVQFAQTTPVVGLAAIVLLVVGPLSLNAALAALGRVSRAAWSVAGGCFLLAIASWPLFIAGPLDSARPSWLVAMLIPAVLQVAMATRSMLVTTMFSVVSMVFLACIGHFVGGLSIEVVLTEPLRIAPFGLLLAGVVTVVRRTADRAAHAQQAVLRRITTARFEDVTEVERVRTDALVHDTILTTLLQAASAEQDDETDRARRMAGNALRVIAHVSRAGQLGAGVRLRSAVSAHEHHLDPAIRSFDIVLDDHQLEDLLLPSDAADALLVAMTEAMNNSVRHANATRRVLRLRALGPDGVRVDVDDDGAGFDYPRRAGAGIRDRILAPMLTVEGRADLTSALGSGTSVHLSWGSVSLADVRSIEARLQDVHA